MEGLGIVVGDFVNIKIRIDPADLLLGILDNRKVAKSKEVHFEKAQFLDGCHRILGDDGIIVAGKGHIITYRFSSNHNTCRVGGGITGHTLQLPCGVDKQANTLVGIVHLLKLGRCGKGFIQSNMGCLGNKLCHRIGFSIAEIQSSANITDRASCRHRTEGRNLGNMVRAVFAHNILDHFSSAFLAEVRIEVGHTDTFGVQKPLENEGVFHGINFRDVHTVCNNGSRAAATTGTNGDAVFLGVADEIPNDQIVVDIAHSANDADLVFKTV